MTAQRPIPDRWAFDPDKGFDIERMNRHIAEWAVYLGLGTWEVKFSLLPPDVDDSPKRAQIDVDVLHRRAALRIDSAVPASQVDRVIVHELLHVLHADMEDTFIRSANELGPSVRAFLAGQWERAQEWVIERLASVVTGTDREDFRLAARVDGPPDPWTTAFPKG